MDKLREFNADEMRKQKAVMRNLNFRNRGIFLPGYLVRRASQASVFGISGHKSRAAPGAACVPEVCGPTPAVVQNFYPQPLWKFGEALMRPEHGIRKKITLLITCSVDNEATISRQ
jgi:hypothetical protein